MKEDIFHLSLKAIIRNYKGEILMLENNPKNSSGLNPPHWDLPGGRLKKGDSVETTLKREIEEEIGLNSLKIIEFFDASLSTFRMPSEKDTVGLILLTYLCSVKNPGDARLVDNEHIRLKWYSTKEAARLVKLKFSKELSQKIKNLK